MKRFLTITTISTLIMQLIVPYATRVRAESPPSIWSAPPSLVSDEQVAEDDRTNAYCQWGEVSQRLYSGVSVTNDVADAFDTEDYQLDTREECLVQNKHGVFGGNLRGTNKWSPSGNPTDVIEMKNAHIIAAPASNAVLVATTYGSDPFGSSRVSVNYNLPGIGKLHIGSRGSGVNRKVFKQWALTDQAPQLHYADGAPMLIRDWAFSKNGRYMVAALTTGMIVRIDLRTQAVQPIASLGAAGRSWMFAISNNGQYVLTHNPFTSGLLFHDLTTCSVQYPAGSYSSGVIDDTGCSFTYIQPDLMAVHPDVDNGLKTFSNFAFSLSGASYSLDISWRKDGINERRRLTYQPEGYVSQAEGYVAMGDSYSSGEGDTEGDVWYEPGTDEQGNPDTFQGRNLCHLSRRSYPYLAAIRTGHLTTNSDTPPVDGLFHSVACAGAKVHNITGILGEKQDEGNGNDFKIYDNQYLYDETASLKVWQPGATKQVSFLTGTTEEETVFRNAQSPEVITLGIGGNDAGFGDYLRACATHTPTTCDMAIPGSYESRQFLGTIAETKVRLAGVYKTVKELAPEARIYVHGYPKFIQGEGGNCAVNVRLDAQERLFLDKVISYGNDVVAAAAAEAGVAYVDVEDILQGRNLCSETEQENMTVNGVTAGNDVRPLEGNPVLVAIGLTNGVCIRACLGSESFHPNAEGHKLYADRLLNATNSFTQPMPEPHATTVPLPDPFFGPDVYSQIDLMNSQGGHPDIQLIRDEQLISDIDYFAKTMTVNLSGLLPNASVELIVRSTPRPLGVFQADENGQLRAEVALPADLEPGYHQVHAVGLDTFANKVDRYQSFIAAVSQDDFDGDGVLNEVDVCQGFADSGVDEDNDGVDDACDAQIFESIPEDPVNDDDPSDDSDEDTDAPQKKRIYKKCRVRRNGTKVCKKKFVWAYLSEQQPYKKVRVALTPHGKKVVVIRQKPYKRIKVVKHINYDKMKML